MRRILRIVNHRDFVLILALIVGLLLAERSRFLADISVYTLALVMVFSTTGFSFRNWMPLRKALYPLAWSAVLNFGLFGMVTVLLAHFFFNDPSSKAFFIGFILLAAAPPGPSVIPFSALLGGDDHFSVTGVFGLHILAMAFTPLILLVFLGQSLVHPLLVLKMMIQLILIPLIISRLLRNKKCLPYVNNIRDTVVKWGFFLVVVPIMGMSANVFLSQTRAVIEISLVVITGIFGLGFAYHALMTRLGRQRGFIVSSTLMLVTKSSAFSAVVAFAFFNDEPAVALPSAVVSVFVTLFIIVYPNFIKMFGRGKKEKADK